MAVMLTFVSITAIQTPSADGTCAIRWSESREERSDEGRLNWQSIQRPQRHPLLRIK